MQFWLPTEHQCSSIAARIAKRHLQLAGCAHKAIDLAVSGNVSPALRGRKDMRRGWVVAGHSGSDYTVLTGIENFCSCSHWRNGGVSAGGFTYCKHLLAVHLVIEGLAREMRPRTLGEMNAINRKMALERSNTYLLRITNTDMLTNLEANPVRLRTRWSERSKMVMFKTDTDAAMFWEWLSGAESLEEDGLAMMSAAYAKLVRDGMPQSEAALLIDSFHS